MILINIVKRIIAIPKSCPGMMLYKNTRKFSIGMYKTVLNNPIMANRLLLY